MAHSISARYEEQEHLFLPPLRTLGFNPQLNINDSLLVQSYIEAYDISYPEALQRIEDEVEELKQHLKNEGSYELNDIGTLALNDEGNYVFAPCEAGILTPPLYGLSSVEMNRLDAIQLEQQPQPIAVVTPEETPEKPTAKIVDLGTDAADTDAEYEEEEEGADIVRIKYSWIRNAVAVAAILIAVFILALPTGKTDMMQRTISNFNNGLLFGMMSEDTNISKIEIKKADIAKVESVSKNVDSVSRNMDSISRNVECGMRNENSLSADSSNISAADSGNESNLIPHSTFHTPQKDATPQKSFCIVLASYVSARNANIFIERLKKQGYDQAEIFERNNIRRVIYGHYASESDAYNDLRRFHRQSETSEAWVMPL